MSIKISELTASGSLTGTEEVPIVQDGETVKTTVQDIVDLASSSGAVWGGITGDITDQTDLVTALNLKVDAVPGKGLSANDFTNTLKTKLDGIQDGAEVNVNADWNATSGDAQILNKPTIPATIGDMTKAVYDPNDTGIVLTASKEMVAVINKTGATIVKGSIVYLKSSSSSGTHPEILLADADTEATSSKTLGATYEDILNDAVGYVVTSGEVDNLNTTAYNIGDKLWLSQTAGQVTTTPPTQPAHTVFIGTVTRSQNTNGRILYAIQNGYELGELHNVLLTSPANNDALVYESSSLLWKNKPIIQSNPFPLFGAGITNVPGAATPTTRFIVFLGLTAVALENQRQIPVPYAVTFKNFFCFFGVGASQPVSGSLVLTIRKNGVDTAITITIPAGSSIGTYSDTTNSESFAAGDLISVKAVNNAISVASGNITSITLGTI
jgi:hypothetical protein